MATSLSDLATRIAQAAPPSGAVFRTTTNPDNSLQVLRAPSATSGRWVILFPRVIFDGLRGIVHIGDGSAMSVENADQFVAGLQ